MAFIDIPNVVVKGFSACVPPDIDENINYSLLTEEERAKVISSIGVERKRVAKDNVSASDLCYKAAEKLIEELHWDKNDIGCLIFVSQTPDYILPATSCLLQHRLGLNSECYTLYIIRMFWMGIWFECTFFIAFSWKYKKGTIISGGYNYTIGMP